MQSSKLIKLLKVLSPEEFRRFKKFIQSPFFTKNKLLLPLYEYLAKYYPVFEASRFSKEHAFRHLFGAERYSPAKINKLTFEMASLIQEFLWISEIQHNDFRKRKVLNEVFGSRNLYPFFQKETESLLENLEAQPFRDMDYYRDLIELNYGKYFHPQNNKYNLKDKSLEQLVDGVDKYFAIAKYRFACELKNRERILAKQYEIKFLETINKNGTAELLDGNVVFELYQILFNLTSTGEERYFFELKAMFFQHVDLLKNDDQLSLFLSGLNFPIQQINRGNRGFIIEAFEWYKFGLQHHLLLQDGELSEVTYGNIVSLSCQTKDFDWTKRFIEDYSKYLNKRIRKDERAFNLGFVLFYEKDYSDAIRLLSTHSFSISHQIKARFLMVRIFFEQFMLDDTYFEILIAQIEAFQKLLKRHKLVSKKHQEAHLNSTQILKRYANAIIQKHNLEADRKKLLDELNSGKPFTIKSWILEKLMN